MAKLQNKVTVITGGNSGIGLATAQLFKAEGAKVIINARNETRLRETKQQLGDAFDILQADVTQANDLEYLFKETHARYGKIDVLFLNAGIAIFKPLAEITEEDYERQMSTNVKGVFFGVQKALPYLNKGASIIINTSIVNQLGMPTSNIYAASKAAARSLVRSLSAELLEHGIRLNAVSPGPISTPIYSKLGLSQEQADAWASNMTQQVPMGRFGKPEEVAKAVLFYATEDSSFVVGTEIEVDGGLATL